MSVESFTSNIPEKMAKKSETSDLQMGHESNTVPIDSMDYSSESSPILSIPITPQATQRCAQAIGNTSTISVKTQPLHQCVSNDNVAPPIIRRSSVYSGLLSNKNSSQSGISRHSIKATMTPPPSPLSRASNIYVPKNSSSAPTLTNLSPLLDTFRIKFSPSFKNSGIASLGLHSQRCLDDSPQQKHNTGVELLVSNQYQYTPSRWRSNQNPEIIILRNVNEVIPNFSSFHSNLRRHLNRRGVDSITLSPLACPIPLQKSTSPTLSLSVGSSVSNSAYASLYCEDQYLNHDYDENIDDENNLQQTSLDGHLNTDEENEIFDKHHSCGIPRVRSLGSLRQFGYGLHRFWNSADSTSHAIMKTNSHDTEIPLGCLSILSIDDNDEGNLNLNDKNKKSNTVENEDQEEFLPCEVMTRELYHDNTLDSTLNDGVSSEKNRVVKSAGAEDIIVTLMTSTKFIRYEGGDDLSFSTNGTSDEDCDGSIEVVGQQEVTIEESFAYAKRRIEVEQYENKNDSFTRTPDTHREFMMKQNRKEFQRQLRRSRSYSLDSSLQIPSLDRSNSRASEHKTRLQNFDPCKIRAVSPLRLEKTATTNENSMRKSNPNERTKSFNDDDSHKGSLSPSSGMISLDCSPLRGSILFHEGDYPDSNFLGISSHSEHNTSKTSSSSLCEKVNLLNITSEERNEIDESSDLLDPPCTYNFARSEQSQCFSNDYSYQLFNNTNHISPHTESIFPSTSHRKQNSFASDNSYQNQLQSVSFSNTKNSAYSAEDDAISILRRESPLLDITNYSNSKKISTSFDVENLQILNWENDIKHVSSNVDSLKPTREMKDLIEHQLPDYNLLNHQPEVVFIKRVSSNSSSSLSSCNNEQCQKLKDLDEIEFLRGDLSTFDESEDNSKHNIQKNEPNVKYLSTLWSDLNTKEQKSFRMDADNHINLMKGPLSPLSLIEQMNEDISSHILSFLDLSSIFHVSLTSRSMLAFSESDELWKIIFRARWNQWTDKIFKCPNSLMVKKDWFGVDNEQRSFWKLLCINFANSKTNELWKTIFHPCFSENESEIFTRFNSNDLSGNIPSSKSDFELMKTPISFDRKRINEVLQPLDRSAISNRSRSNSIIESGYGTPSSAQRNPKEKIIKANIDGKNYKRLLTLAILPNNNVEVYFRDDHFDDLDLIERERIAEDELEEYIANFMYCSKDNPKGDNVIQADPSPSTALPNRKGYTKRLCTFGEELGGGSCNSDEDWPYLDNMLCTSLFVTDAEMTEEKTYKYVSISGDLSPQKRSSVIDNIINWIMGPEEKKKKFENYKAPSLKLKNKNSISSLKKLTIENNEENLMLLPA